MATDRCYTCRPMDQHPEPAWVIETANWTDQPILFCDFCLQDLLANMLKWGGQRESSIRGIRLV